jgi:hypothetical protein
LREAALPLRLALQAEGWSPNCLMTGSWNEAAQRLEAETLRRQWRTLRVSRIVEESSVIRSLYLEPVDGAGLALHQPGQHLPIRVKPAGNNTPAIRTYTLSSAPSDGIYRLSVKRQGLVSDHLHRLAEGDLIEARAPAGSFTLDPLASRPAVLLAAGVGITPILAMLRAILFEGLRKRRIRPTTLFYAARNRAERAFDAELAALVAQGGGAIRLVRVLEDVSDARAGEHHEAEGRIDADLLRRVLAFDAYDFYLCGPPPFMQGLYDQLTAIGVPDARIHAESFGPAALTRKVAASAPPLVPAATGAVPVVFTVSGKEARWTPADGTLLDLAEGRGLMPAFSCRTGSCGTCATRILAGKVTYASRPAAHIADDEALICCALPAPAKVGDSDRLVLQL